MTTPSERRCCSVRGDLIARASLLETGRVEAADVVDGAALQRELGEHAAHPWGELVAGAPPPDADERVREAGYGAEDEVVVGDEVVVALVDVLDVAHLRRPQPG